MPDWLEFVVVILAAYRLTRLAGWDDFPLAVKLRAWVIGQRWIVAPLVGERFVSYDEAEAALADYETTSTSQFPRPQMVERESGEEVSLPGKQPPSELEGIRPAYDRPTLAHLVHCPFCIGFWISLIVSVAWLIWHPVAYGLLPFAVSGAVGLIAKNLD